MAESLECIRELIVEKSADHVWNWLSDLRNAMTVNQFHMSIECDEAAARNPRVGRDVLILHEMMGHRFYRNAHITKFERYEIAWGEHALEDCGYEDQFPISEGWRVEPLGPNQCRVQCYLRGSFRSPMGDLIGQQAWEAAMPVILDNDLQNVAFAVGAIDRKREIAMPQNSAAMLRLALADDIDGKSTHEFMDQAAHFLADHALISKKSGVVDQNKALPLGSVSVDLVNALLQFAKKKNLDVKALCAELSLSNILLSNLDARIDFTVHERLWLRLIHELKNPDLGYQFGRFISENGWRHIPFLIAMHCADARQMLSKIVEYKGLLYDGDPFSIAEYDGLTVLQLGQIPFEENVLRHSCDAILSGIDRLISLNSMETIKPVFIRVPYLEEEKPVLASMCKNLSFSHHTAEIAYRTRDLTKTNPLADYRLRQSLEAHAHSRIQNLKRSGQWSKRASSIIYQDLSHRMPTLETVAEYFSLSGRSLQKKLKEEGTSFRLLLDNVRLMKSCHLLKDPTYSIAQIGQTLGFAEQSAFNHFFKQQTRQTPSAFRRSILTSGH